MLLEVTQDNFENTVYQNCFIWLPENLKYNIRLYILLK